MDDCLCDKVGKPFSFHDQPESFDGVLFMPDSALDARRFLVTVISSTDSQKVRLVVIDWTSSGSGQPDTKIKDLSEKPNDFDPD